MSRYIDAEWIRNIYADFEHYENRDDWTTPITNVLAVIDDAPTIDIVRCKDCKFSKVYQADSRGAKCRVCKAYRHSRLTSDDGFCSDGERIEE